MFRRLAQTLYSSPRHPKLVVQARRLPNLGQVALLFAALIEPDHLALGFAVLDIFL